MTSARRPSFVHSFDGCSLSASLTPSVIAVKPWIRLVTSSAVTESSASQSVSVRRSRQSIHHARALDGASHVSTELQPEQNPFRVTQLLFSREKWTLNENLSRWRKEWSQEWSQTSPQYDQCSESPLRLPEARVSVAEVWARASHWYEGFTEKNVYIMPKNWL